VADREAMSFLATTSGITGEDIRDLMVGALSSIGSKGASRNMLRRPFEVSLVSALDQNLIGFARGFESRGETAHRVAAT
jgi:hypothetical protein